jgi:4-hydroxy-2-oxoheptanedioate aldolase
MRDPDQLREAWRGGGPPAFGVWAAIPSSVTTEAAAASGADYVVIDEQHGAIGPEQMLAMIQGIDAAGAVPLVRVGRNDTWVIGHALDLGAAGVIVPMVDDAAGAAAAVAACRYAPDGARSYGALRGGPVAKPLCLVMVETRAGLDNAEEIAATPGLDGVYVGPADLALSLGFQPGLKLEHAPVLEAIERIRALCDERGMIASVHCLNPDDAGKFARQGFGMITIGVDLLYLRGALARALGALRGA